MMRRVTMLGIAALILLHPTGDAHAGLFGSSRASDEADDRGSRSMRDADGGFDRGDAAPPREEDAPRSPHGMRSREVPRRSRPAPVDDADDRGSRASARDGDSDSRSSRDSRDDALPRSARRRDESANEGAAESEAGKFEKKMNDLHRQLEEAEQSENARKIKAVKWMIQREEERHETAQSSAQVPARRTAKARVNPTYEQPDRDSGDHADRGADDRAPRYGDDRASSSRSASRDDGEDHPRSSRFASSRGDDQVSNPLTERSKRRRGDDPDARSRSRSDRDEDEQDEPGRSHREATRFSNAARVAQADGGIRRY